MSVIAAVSLEYAPDSAGHVRAAVEKAAAATTTEDGCIGYRSFRSDQQANTIIIVEKWRDHDAADTHQSSPALRTLLDSVRDHLVAPLAVVLMGSSM